MLMLHVHVVERFHCLMFVGGEFILALHRELVGALQINR